MDERLADVARTLGLDRVTAALSIALEERGIRSILLKGPAIAQRLYPPGAFRPYDDIDLLVDAAHFLEVGTLLADLGFLDDHVGASESECIPYARVWRRANDGAVVDLHATLMESGVGPDEVWRILSSRTVPLVVSGVPVEVLDIPALLTVVALHAAHHGLRLAKPIEDLRRAVIGNPPEDWAAAAAIAARLGAGGTFLAGLSLVPSAAQLAAQLQALPSLEGFTAPPLPVSLRGMGAPQVSEGLARLVAEQGLANRLRLLARELLPSPTFMRLHWPVARGGPVGLGLAYVQRLGVLARDLGPGLRALRAAQVGSVSDLDLPNREEHP